MTIRNREWSNRLDNMTACANNAPWETYKREKEIVNLIADLTDTLIRKTRAMGLDAPNCDEAREVECALYAYIAEANPLAVAAGEGFGASMDTPARERVIQQAADNFAALQKVMG